ncbi:uncharacterized protein METZ01_LOCUS427637 [marine metagenome]|uniref:Uncharacterized protein n=1 Tax=marine metagenome TaxID=408172 RepID=A0A382XUW0_9ZZZZ
MGNYSLIQNDTDYIIIATIYSIFLT